MRTVKFKSKSVLLLTAALFFSLPPSAATGTGEMEARARGRVSSVPQSTDISQWLLISPRGERFTVRMPAVPRVFVAHEEGDKGPTVVGGQEIKRHRTYHAYHDGSVFLAHFYKTSKPEKLLKGMLEEGYFRETFVRDFRANGLAAKEYEARSESSYRKAHFVVSSEYLYRIEVGVRDAGHLAVEAFLSSFKVGQPNPAGVSEPAPIVGASAPVVPSDKALTATEVTRKAVLLYRPWPKYTLKAQEQGTVGRVTLRLNLGADGVVAGISPVEELPHGLTEKAIEVARNVRFLPAEKDGRKVSQYVTIQYNFNLY